MMLLLLTCCKIVSEKEGHIEIKMRLASFGLTVSHALLSLCPFQISGLLMKKFNQEYIHVFCNRLINYVFY